MKRLVICFLSVVLVAGFLIMTVFHAEPMVTGKRAEIAAVSIVFIDADNGYFEVHTPLDEPDAISKIYSLLKNSEPRTIKKPSHAQSIHLDHYAEIIFVYEDGHEDRICAATTCWYRFLDTRGGSGDPGFVITTGGDALLQMLRQHSP